MFLLGAKLFSSSLNFKHFYRRQAGNSQQAEENVYQNNLKEKLTGVLWFCFCLSKLVLAAPPPPPPAPSRSPPRTNRKHSRPDHARAIKVEINIANTTFTAPRILARSCLSWNWFFVFKPKLVASLVAWLPAWQNLNEKIINFNNSLHIGVARG